MPIGRRWIRKMLLTSLGVLLLSVSLLVGACSPQQGDQASDGYTPNPNVSVIQGESDTVTDPDMLADGNSGTAIVGNDEEVLQQDRISGGANTGGVSSQNLDPLTSQLIEPTDKREAASNK